MKRRASTASILLAAGLIAAACSSPDSRVETQSADMINASPNSAPATAPPGSQPANTEPSGTNAPTTSEVDAPADPATDPAADPAPDGGDLPAPSGDGLLFELPDFTVEVTLRETIAPNPPDGYDGFQSALILPDGSLLASGFDARANGFQPERSSLWHSVDGNNWEPVGNSIGAPADQQSIIALYLDRDDTAHALVSNFTLTAESNGTTTTKVDLSVDWVSDDGMAWGSDSLIGNDFVAGGAMFGDLQLAYGAARPNNDGEFVASILRQPDGPDTWTSEPIVDASGQPYLASVVFDMVLADDALIAVGGTAHTDPLSGLAGTLFDMAALERSSDVAIWRSEDDGASWTFITTTAFSGVSGPAVGQVITELEGSLYLLSRTVEAFQPTLALNRSDDGGLTWTRIQFERALTLSREDTQLTNVGLYVVDGFIVVLEERFNRSQDMYMTVIDPATEESVTHSITDELGVMQIEDILESERVGIGFGRRDLGATASDLQVVEIRRVDAAETATSTATPIG